MYNTNNRKTPRIGDVFMVKFEGEGTEQRGYRPAIIFQNNTGNLYSPNVIVLPLTSRIKKSSQPTHVIVRASDSGLKLDSMVLCENPMCISKNRLGAFVTTLSDEYIGKIARAHILATSSIAFIDMNNVSSLQEMACKLNSSM